MRTWEWQKYLDAQRREHGKTVFSVAEMANIARLSPESLNVQLARLIKRGVLLRYARGVYGLPEGLTASELLYSMDSHAYVTSVSALFHHGMITQRPSLFVCFTDRRHNRSRERTTPAGRFVFVTVKKPVYFPPVNKNIAPPEQALCDFVYLMRRSGIDPQGTVTFRNLNRLGKSFLKDTLRRYPGTVQKHVSSIVKQNETG